jgi:hypothetical protein
METHSLTHLMSVSEVHVIACKSCDEAEQFDWTAIQMTGRMKIGTVCLYGERLELQYTLSTQPRPLLVLLTSSAPRLPPTWRQDGFITAWWCVAQSTSNDCLKHTCLLNLSSLSDPYCIRTLLPKLFLNIHTQHNTTQTQHSSSNPSTSRLQDPVTATYLSTVHRLFAGSPVSSKTSSKGHLSL